MSDQDARDGGRAYQCWNCDGELEQRENELKCLDCGGEYEIAPTGEMVKHRRVWWLLRVGYAGVLGAFIYSFIIAVVDSSWLFAAFVAVILPVYCYREGPKIMEAIRHA